MRPWPVTNPRLTIDLAVDRRIPPPEQGVLYVTTRETNMQSNPGRSHDVWLRLEGNPLSGPEKPCRKAVTPRAA